MNERQELHCHNCDNYVQFDIDMELNGKCVIICPSCGHEHLRYVDKGIITDQRWGSRNMLMVPVRNVTYTAVSYTMTAVSSTAASSTAMFLADSWMNTLQVQVDVIHLT